ncbi:MAG: hypothetical protein ACFE75_00535 [Candidatus Hodarchaeota archaeon]
MVKSFDFIYVGVALIDIINKNLNSNIKLGNYITGKCIQKLIVRNGNPTAKELIMKFPQS